MTWELLDHDASLGRSKWIASGDEPDTVLVKTTFEEDHTDAILDANKAGQIDNTGPMGDMVHAASIPVGVMYEWIRKFGVNAWNPHHMDGVKRLLNSSDYRYLKCRNIIL
jgi:hypothetical protein